MNLRDLTASLPPFTDDPIDRLKHILAIYASSPDDRMILTGIRDRREPEPATTGLSLGDLRALLILIKP